jgi:hypothetical protein
MSLAPASSFTLGELRYDSHAVELVATLGVLPAVDSFRVRLPSGADVRCSPGDPALLELDGGEGKTTVLTGKVRGVKRGFDVTDVTAADAGADLAAVRPAATYDGIAAQDVIAALASEAGVSVGVTDLDLPLAAYATHQRRTSAEHVAYLARLGGGMACVDGDGSLTIRQRPSGPADAALLYGRELLRCEIRSCPGADVAQVTVGNGAAGTADAPDALRPSADVLPGDAPAPGPAAIWEPAAILRTPKTAVAASNAAADAFAAGGKRLRALCFLLPSLRPGMCIEIQSLPDALGGGRWLLTRVVHRLRRNSAGTTVLEAESADATPHTSLLGAALSALGSVL